jgi:hypothetical protein
VVLQVDPDDIHYDEDLVGDAAEIIEAIKMMQALFDVIFSKRVNPLGYVLCHHDL